MGDRPLSDITEWRDETLVKLLKVIYEGNIIYKFRIRPIFRLDNDREY